MIMKKIIALLFAIIIAISTPLLLTYADLDEYSKARIKRALAEIRAEELAEERGDYYQTSEPSEYETALRQSRIKESIEVLKQNGYFDRLTYHSIPLSDDLTYAEIYTRQYRTALNYGYNKRDYLASYREYHKQGFEQSFEECKRSHILLNLVQNANEFLRHDPEYDSMVQARIDKKFKREVYNESLSLSPENGADYCFISDLAYEDACKEALGTIEAAKIDTEFSEAALRGTDVGKAEFKICLRKYKNNHRIAYALVMLPNAALVAIGIAVLAIIALMVFLMRRKVKTFKTSIDVTALDEDIRSVFEK